MTTQVNVQFPFEACEYCTMMSLATEMAYADHRPFMITHYCENMKICENAVDIVNRSMQMQVERAQQENIILEENEEES